jgi:hypothetical protein
VGDVVRIPGVSYLVQDRLFDVPRKPSSPVGKRNTKSIGDISESRVLAALTGAGYLVSRPFGENCRYDLIADDGERLHRVQVKTGRLRNGVIVFNCYSSHAHRGGPMRPYFGQVEYLAVYCPQNEKVYLLPEQELTASTAHLRVSPTRNNMAKTIRWAAQFELS